MQNVYEALREVGHDEDFTPKKIPAPTHYAPGSPGKVKELRRRVLCGEQLWNNFDNPICERAIDNIGHANHRLPRMASYQRSRPAYRE